MSTIPIVQGVVVPQSSVPYGTTESESYNKTSGYSRISDQHIQGPNQSVYEAEQKSHQQPIQKYQDIFWAVLFVFHLMAILAVIFVGFSNREAADGNTGSLFSIQIVYLVSVTGLVAVSLSIASLAFMMRHAETMVQTALLFSVATSLTVGIVGFLTGSILIGCLGLLSFAIGICYARIVWPRIPFSAANLKTALSCVNLNLGLAVVSLGFTLLAFGWTMLWFMGVGTFLGTSNLAVVFVLFLSYYWVHQVLQNVMHVTTAGVVGTFWWAPMEANSFWSPALNDSLFRATTWSFGSVCFGSLLVALVQSLRALEYHARSSDDMQFLSCIIQCILSCIQDIVEELNRWSYVYVGIYGFSYLEAGRNVIELFKAKGWTVIISNDLTDNVMFMISVAIGLASGLVGLAISFMDKGLQKIISDMGFENAAGPAFVVGFLAGFLFATIIMSVVASAVNTVIVCFAEDPAAFQLNHPELSLEMRDAWVKAWPGVVTF